MPVMFSFDEENYWHTEALDQDNIQYLECC